MKRSLLGPLPILLVLVWASVRTAIVVADFLSSAAERDFGIFYASSLQMAEGGSWYPQTPGGRVNMNAPHVSWLLFRAWAAVPLPVMATLWVMTSAVLNAVSLFWIFRDLRIPARRALWIVALLLLSIGFEQQSAEGQLGALLFALGTLVWRHRTSGWLAALVSLKPWLGLWLIPVSNAVRMRTVVLGLGAIMGSLVFIGTTPWIEWIDLHVTPRTGAEHVLIPTNTSLHAMLARSQGLAFSRLTPVGVLLGGALMVLAVRRQRHQGKDADRPLLAFGLLGILLSPTSWAYYVLALVAPLIAWGERHNWPIGARIAVGVWMVPLDVAIIVAGRWDNVGSLYALGLLLLLFVVVLTDR